MMIPDYRGFSGNNELYHHGILGQKWGVRRFQNANGTLTEQGKKRYNKLNSKIETLERKKQKAEVKAGKTYITEFGKASVNRNIRKYFKYDNKLKMANKKLSELSSLSNEGQKYVDEILNKK